MLYLGVYFLYYLWVIFLHLKIVLKIYDLTIQQPISLNFTPLCKSTCTMYKRCASGLHSCRDGRQNPNISSLISRRVLFTVLQDKPSITYKTKYFLDLHFKICTTKTLENKEMISSSSCLRFKSFISIDITTQHFCEFP